MKRLLLLFVFAAFIGSNTNAQSQRLWEKSAGASYSWFSLIANSNVTSLAYNPSTGHLLVSNRNDKIYILDAANGDVLDTLSVTGLTVGAYDFNKVRVDDNGVIYAAQMRTSAGINKIFRWENENSDPTIIEYWVAARNGDSFGISGSGASTVLYTNGSGISKIYMLTTTDGVAFTKTDSITITGNFARSGIEPVSVGTSSDLWINSPGNPALKISSTGTVKYTSSAATLANAFSAIKYFSSNGYKFLAATGYNTSTLPVEGVKMTILDVTNEAQVKVFETVSLTNTYHNQTGSGDIAFKNNGDGTFTFFQLVLNNGIAAYTTKTPAVSPVFNSLGKVYHMKDSLTVTSAAYNAAVYYTVNGSDPDSVTGTKYTSPIVRTTDGVLKAIAYSPFRQPSEIVSYTLTFPTVQAALPTAALLGNKNYFDLTQGATVTSTETGAEIYYTVNGDEPTYLSTPYTDTLSLSFGQTLKAIVYAPDRTPSPVASVNVTVPADTAKAAAFDPAGGLYLNSPIDVALTSVTPDAKIYFTLDGTEPDYTDSLYTDTLSITPDAYFKRVIKAKVYAENYLPSPVDSVVYTFPAGTKLPKPTLTGIYDYYNNTLLAAMNAGDTAKVYYTLKGGVPTPDSTEYVDTLTFTANTTILAIAYAVGYVPSDVDTLQLTFPTDTVKALAFTPDGDEYESSQTVTITSETAGAEIYYTLNGTTPNNNSELYTAPVEVQVNSTLKAIAYAPNMVRTKVKTANYLPKAMELYPIWGKSPNYGKIPSYFGANTERGMAYGHVDGKDRVYVVSRNLNPIRILVYDALTGDSVGTIKKPEPDKGYFPLNTIEVNEEGIIFATSLTLDAGSDHPFVVYRWDSETAEPKEVINYQSGGRLGDMFSVFGKASDNTLTIFACVSAGTKIVKFTTTDNGNTFTPAEINLTGTDVSTSPNVALTGDGTFYFTSYGRPTVHYTADGVPMDTVKASAVPAEVSRIKYHENASGKYLVTYLPRIANAEKLSVVNLTDGDKKAYIQLYTKSIGSVANTNAVGAIDFKKIDEENYIFYILGLNNGFAAFSTSSTLALAQYDTLFYGTTKNLLANPNGTGYVAGTNSRGDLGKYQSFIWPAFLAGATKPNELKGINVQFAFAQVKDTPDTLYVVVRNESGSGEPDSLLASFELTTDMINTMDGNTFIFDTPLPIEGSFFIGVEWSAAFDDTVAIYSDKNGEGDNEGRAWEKYADGSFGKFNQSASWNLDADLWIYAYYKEGGIIGVNDVENTIPEQYALNQNYPNPFNPSTVISFSLRIESKVSLKVYNILGQEIAHLINGSLAAGNQEVTFNASRLASGVYIYRLEVSGVDGSKFSAVKKMMFLK